MSNNPYREAMSPTTSRDSAPSSPERSVSSTAVTTRSLGYGAGVSIEYPPSEDSDLVFVAVRLRDDFRKASVDGADDLPSRPSVRGFFSRLHTRVAPSHTKREGKFKALRMPRADFQRYFVRDGEGNYSGSEPERLWSEAELMQEYGKYQGDPLRPMKYISRDQGMLLMGKGCAL